MLAALEGAPDWTLDVVGPVAADDAAWLERWRSSSPAAGRARFHGRMPPAAAWRLAAGAWVGLCMLEDTPAFRDAVPSKIYEYLAAGLAVVTTPLPRAAEIVEFSRGGLVLPDATALSATLRSWAERPQELQPMRAAAAEWAREAFGGASAYDELARRLRELSSRP
jgi:glycosyltransferase involved in cell wall biosynthesis